MSSIYKTLKYIEIETCSACTRNCEWCPHGSNEEYKNRKLEYLETEYIKLILKELKSIDFKGIISFCSINEPLMDDRITSGKLFTLCRKILSDAKIVLITNGDLLTEENLQNMFKKGLDKLIVSCYDDKTYNKTTDYVKKHIYYIEQQDKRYFNNGDWEYNRAGSIACKNNFTYKQCFIPMFQSIVGYDGEVRLCCYDALGNIKLGNIKHKKLIDILSADETNNLRKQLRKDRSMIYPCNICNVKGSVETLFRNNGKL